MSSLGWLTESAFIPKESKKINVGQNSSLVDLKAKILEEKAKLSKRREEGLDSQKKIKNDKKNSGIEERIKRDEQSLQDKVEDDQGKIDHRKIEFKLQEKAQIYEQLIRDKKAHEKGKHHLVDYEQKRWNQEPNAQEQQHDYLSEMNTLNDIMARERKAWEAEARREIALTETGQSLGSIKPQDSATAMLGQSLAPLVKQQWDSILTNKEKEHLPEVIKDKQRQQEIQILAKRKRELDRDQRLLKIEELKKRRKID